MLYQANAQTLIPLTLNPECPDVKNYK